MNTFMHSLLWSDPVQNIIKIYRTIKIAIRQLLDIEPIVKVKLDLNLESHGSEYGGWSIVANSLNDHSVVVDIGLGEDISFSQSLIEKYKLVVHGYDPTPKSVNYIKSIKQKNFIFHEYAIGTRNETVKFYLPNNSNHISGSVICEQHLGHRDIDVKMITISDIFKMLKCERIDLFKLDIEGAEFELIKSKEFEEYSTQINMICIEFHHRWPSYCSDSTLQAVKTLAGLGFSCAWKNKTTNEEFLFVRTN